MKGTGYGTVRATVEKAEITRLPSSQAGLLGSRHCDTMTSLDEKCPDVLRSSHDGMRRHGPPWRRS